MSENVELIKRLENIERQHRRMKRGGLAVITVLTVLAFMGADGDKREVLDEIRVKKLVVEDDAGTVRCQVHSNAGSTVFRMYDVRGKARVVLNIDEKRRTAGFSLLQSDGRMRLGSGATDGGAAWVNLLHPRGRVARGMASQ